MGPDTSKDFYENFLQDLRKNYKEDLIKGDFFLFYFVQLSNFVYQRTKTYDNGGWTTAKPKI